MGLVKIVTGPHGSGKTRWANKWVAEAPEKRRVVSNLAAGLAALNAGLDVVMDLEQLSQHGVEVVTFSA